MEIIFETEETVVLREGSRVALDRCESCGRDVLMATPQAAAFVARTSEREIFRLIEQDVVHFNEKGCVMVCLESVRALAARAELDGDPPSPSGRSRFSRIMD